MTRLPQPGSDSGQWGNILNEYLLASHKPDGSLKDGIVTNNNLAPNAVSSSAIQDNAVTEAKLSAEVRDKLNATGPGATGVSSVNTRTGAVTLTKSDVGLANVDNTSDANKPISTAVQTALSGKANASHTHTKADVGLSNVDNTSDIDKPISTAVQAALTAKADNVHVHALGDLMDVESSGASNGQSLVFNNGTWGPATVSSEGGTITDATSTTKGVVQLAGDLSGTAGAPVIGNGRVSTAKLADGSVATAKLADNSVAAAKLADNAVTGAKVANNSISRAKLNAGAGSNGQVLTYDSAAGGGFRWSTVSVGQGLVWNGTSAPAGATDGDLWIDTSNLEEVKLKALVGGQWISLATGSSSDGEPAPTQLDAPTNVTTLPGDSQVIVSFNPVAGATSYTVTSSPGNVTATGGGSPITVTGLVNGTSYTFTVTATDGTRTSAPSSPSNSIEPVAPDPDPDNILMLGDYAGREIRVENGTLSGKTITLSGTGQTRLTIVDEPLPIGTANTMNLQIDASPRDGTWVIDWFDDNTNWLDYTEKTADGEFAIVKPTGATRYKASWRLFSTATINSMTVAVSTVSDTTPPSAVTNLSASPSDTSVNLTWTAASDNLGVTSYEVRVGSGSWQDVGNVINYRVTGLTADTDYNFSVRAKDGAGNVGVGASVSARTTTTPSPGGSVSPSDFTVGGSVFYPVYLGTGTVAQRDVSNMPIGSNSATVVSKLAAMERTYLEAGDYSLPTYIVNSNQTPKVSVAVRDFDGSDKAQYLPVSIRSTVTQNVPIPTSALPAAGTDGALVIYDIATDITYSYWIMRKDASGQWYCNWAGAQLGSTNLSRSWSYATQHTGGSLSASGLVAHLYSIGVDEVLEKGSIDHALAITVPEVRNVYSWPATQHDGGASTDPTMPIEGQWFRLKPSYNIDATSFNPLMKMVLRALQNYGGTTVDRTHYWGSTGRGVINFSGERSSRWNTVYSQFGTNDFSALNGMPWDQMEFAPVDWGKP